MGVPGSTCALPEERKGSIRTELPSQTCGKGIGRGFRGIKVLLLRSYSVLNQTNRAPHQRNLGSGACLAWPADGIPERWYSIQFFSRSVWPPLAEWQEAATAAREAGPAPDEKLPDRSRTPAPKCLKNVVLDCPGQARHPTYGTLTTDRVWPRLVISSSRVCVARKILSPSGAHRKNISGHSPCRTFRP